MIETQLLALVGLIYDAAQDPARWTEFLQQYASLLDFHIAQLELVTSNGAFSIGSSIGMSESELLEQVRCSPLNPWLPLVSQAASGAVGTSHELVPDTVYLKSDYYHELGRRIDQFYGQAGLVIANSAATSIIAGVRSKSMGPCGQQETEILQTLLPHLARALRMHAQFVQLDAQARSLLDSLDRLKRGFVLLDERGCLIRANRAAEEMAAQNDGLHLSKKGLRAANPAESAALQKLVFEAARTANGQGLASGGTMAISRPSLRRPWIATVSPHRSTVGNGLAAVLLVDPEETRVPSSAFVAQAFGLTRSETRLALLLAAGVRLEDAADQLGITMNTARTHTRRILDKVGVKRQIDMILLLNKIPPGEA